MAGWLDDIDPPYDDLAAVRDQWLAAPDRRSFLEGHYTRSP